MRLDHNREFDKEIKKKFDEFLPEVSSSLWDGIEKEIKNETSIKPKLINHKLLHSAFFIGIAASLLIVGFSIWKLQPEEKVFLRGSESLVKNADSGLTRTNSENAVVEIDHSRAMPNNELVDDARIAKSSKVKISGTEIQEGLAFEESTFAETSEFLKPASGLESKNLEPLDQQNLTQQNQELALNAPIQDNVFSISNPVNQDANGLTTPDIENGDRLFGAKTNVSIPNGEENLLEAEPKEKQKIVSSVLNFLASNLQIGGDKVVEFSETENGIIKVDLKGIFARNNHQY